MTMWCTVPLVPFFQGCKLLQLLQIDKCYSVSASAVEALLKRLPSASKARYWTGFAPQSAMIVSYHKRRVAQVEGAKSIQRQVRHTHTHTHTRTRTRTRTRTQEEWLDAMLPLDQCNSVTCCPVSVCVCAQFRVYLMKKKSWEERMAEARRITQMRDDAATQIQRIARGMIARVRVRAMRCVPCWIGWRRGSPLLHVSPRRCACVRAWCVCVCVICLRVARFPLLWRGWVEQSTTGKDERAPGASCTSHRAAMCTWCGASTPGVAYALGTLALGTTTNEQQLHVVHA